MYIKKLFFLLQLILCIHVVNTKASNKNFFEDTLKFRIIDIPADDSNYFRIIERGKSVTMHSGRVFLKAGENVGEHSTEDYEELIIILKGAGEAENQAKERFKIKEGQVIYIPPNSTHNIYNTSSEPLIYIYIVAKAK